MNNVYKITAKEWLFLVFFSLITIGKSFGSGADNKILQYITVLALILLATKLVITKYSYKEAITCLVLGMIGFTSYVVTKREGVLLSILTLIGMKNISINRLLKVTFILRGIIFCLLIFFSKIGIVENVQLLHWRDSTGYVIRQSLGNGHPNLLHANFFILVMLFIYLYYSKLKWSSYFIILLLNFSLYQFSITRTGYYTIIFIVILTIFVKNNYIKEKLFYMMGELVIPFCTIFTLTTALLYYKSNFIQSLDNLFSGRIFYSNHFLTHYSWNLFGRSLVNDTNLLDNGYVVILINYGLVIMILYLVGYYKAIKNFISINFNPGLLMIFAFSIYGVTEGFLPNIFLNLSMLFFINILFKNDSYS